MHRSQPSALPLSALKQAIPYQSVCKASLHTEAWNTFQSLLYPQRTDSSCIATFPIPYILSVRILSYHIFPFSALCFVLKHENRRAFPTLRLHAKHYSFRKYHINFYAQINVQLSELPIHQGSLHRALYPTGSCIPPS